MYTSQEHTIGRNQSAKLFQRLQEIFQHHLYQHAEFITKKKQRRYLTGYLIVFPILALTLLLTLGLHRIIDHYIFENAILVLAFSFTALWWGVGPALFLLSLGAVTLDLFVVEPLGELETMEWPNMLQLFPMYLTGIVIGILSFQRDKGWAKTQMHVHELQTLKRHMEAEKQRKDRFLSIASHELKTPVTSIRLQAQLLKRRLTKKPLTEESASILQALEKIEARTRTLTDMIDELRDLSLIQCEKMAFKPEIHDMNALCQEVVEEQQLATGRSLLFQRSIDAALVYGDSQRLTQVVNNLVSNAIKYSPTSSSIKIGLKRDTQHITVQIRDYGPGIEQDQIDRIFEAYYRTREAQSSAVGGLGLGLAIVKEIVTLHKGRIWCVSQKGHGSTFYVELPLYSQTAPLENADKTT